MSSNPRSKGWFLTSNDSHQTHFDTLKSMNYRYLYIGAKELAPTTGHEHYHIILYFDNARTFSSIQKQLRTCNIQPLKSFSAAKKYLVKDGSATFEDGDPPHQGSKTCDPDELKTMSNKDCIAAFGKNCHSFIKARDILNAEINVDDVYKQDLKVYYIFGPSGVGKSKLAKQIIRERNSGKCVQVKYCNGFWINPGESNAAWYDDFRDSHMPASEFINFIDYNQQLLNIKGGHVRNCYTTIVITSIQSPMEIYKNLSSEPRSQWLRRMEIINLTPSSEEPVGEINVDDL